MDAVDEVPGEVQKAEGKVASGQEWIGRAVGGKGA